MNIICNQNSPEISEIKMGLKKTSFNGCGWVAIYNIMALCGREVTYQEIIKYLERNGGLILFGLFGTNPFAVCRYFKMKGMQTEKFIFPKELDDKIKTLAILYYFHSKGGHYIAIRRTEKNFVAYNVFCNSDKEQCFCSVDSFLKSYNSKPFFLMTW